jgi:hypothetical protein
MTSAPTGCCADSGLDQLTFAVDHGGNQPSRRDFYAFCSEHMHALSVRLQGREHRARAGRLETASVQRIFTGVHSAELGLV